MESYLLIALCLLQKASKNTDSPDYNNINKIYYNCNIWLQITNLYPSPLNITGFYRKLLPQFPINKNDVVNDNIKHLITR